MKQHLRTFACGSLMTLAIFLAACGGRETMASKSAAAYREAQAKGSPIGGGDGHDHAGASETTTQDHSAHGSASATTDPHAGMNHDMTSDHATMDHSAMNHSAHNASTNHEAMGHGTATAHAGHDMTTSPSNAHAGHASASPANAHAGHDMAATTNAHATHGASASAPTGAHAHHTTATPATVAVEVPSSNAAIAAVRPAATLAPDDFDAPAAKSVAESAKASGGAHSNHAPQNNAEEIYSCPMHPEVTSATPGQCPKCGMTLVKRNKQ